MSKQSEQWKQQIDYDVRTAAETLAEEACDTVDWADFKRRAAYLVADLLDKESFRLVQHGLISPQTYAQRNVHLEGLMLWINSDEGVGWSK